MYSSHCYFACFLWLVLGTSCPLVLCAGETSLAKRLDSILDQHPTARRTTVALKVVDLTSGDVLYDRGGDLLLTPASNLKIYTSACALDTFGPDHRFQTKLQVSGPLNEGVLQGDLILSGGGDAMLSRADIAKIADRVVQEMGIREIQGRVVADNTRYASPLKGPGWMWDDDPDYYNMSVTPLMLDFNVLSLQLSPSQQGIQAVLELPSRYPPIQFVSREAIQGPDLATRRPFTHPILVAQDAELAQPATFRLTMHDPGVWVSGVFTEMLVARGVRFSAPSETSSSSDGPLVSGSFHLGPSLTSTLKHFHQESENAVGEVLLHEIAISQGIRRPRWSEGAEAISRWLVEKAGLEPDSFRLVDGSGLSRYNLISAHSAVRLLEFMHHHPHADTFMQSLKSYDVTLAGEKLPLVAAKPGGMASVSTISGYLKTTSGRLLVFSLLANGFTGSARPVFDLREQIWSALASEDDEQ